MKDDENRRYVNENFKNNLVPKDNTNTGQNSPMGNFSKHLPTNIKGLTKTPEGEKIPHSENQIQPVRQKEKIILVAEDDIFNFFLIESLLIPYNCKIIHARNGEEAVRIFKLQEKISLILMDIQMPVMDGFTATKEIRKIDNKVPIIAQTRASLFVDEVRERAIDSGCNDFLTKPIDSDLLIHKIEKYITIKANYF